MNFNNRTFHLLLKADILTCYEHGYKVKQDSYVVGGSFRAASRLMAEDRGWKLQQRVFCILADKL